MIALSCDILVVGSGGAGLTAAIHARNSGMDTVVINKAPVAHSGSTLMAIGGLAAVDSSWMSEGDSTELHIEDTLRGGKHLNELPLVRRIVEGAAEAAKELERMGVMYDRDPESGRIALLRPDAGHSKNRALSAGRRIGHELVQTLYGEALKVGVRMLGCMTLISVEKTKEGRACGAICLDTVENELTAISARAVVIASGGAGNLYSQTDAPMDVTGDACAAALLAGACVTDMEFFQFHPTGLLKPDSRRGFLGTHLSLARLYNGRHERFMQNYDAERLERSTRDTVSRAMMLEIRAGRGSANGGIYAGLTHLDRSELEKKLPEYMKLYSKLGIDPSKDLIELSPTAHYTMGGLRVNESWETDLPGLFAAGEVCGGVHGANRLSQNALTEMLVSGMTAGDAASEYAGKTELCSISDERAADAYVMLKGIIGKKGLNTMQWRERLQSIMSDKAGVLRSREGLTEAISELITLRSTDMSVSDSAGDIQTALENRAMSLLALTTAYAALSREESRGSHMRLDCPETDEENGYYHTVFRIRGKRIEAQRVPVSTGETMNWELDEDAWQDCDIAL